SLLEFGMMILEE
nr:RecName: Full=Basic phospholipase A2; Short=svPLA2; AltName: Full=Phosphatidylcholine 2-acylhydrolase [Vipera berus]